MNGESQLHGIAVLLACLAWAATAMADTSARPATLRIATVAPVGSSFDKRLQALNSEWSRGPGQVRMDVYAGGSMGGELAIVRRLKQGQLQGAMLTSVGLGQIDRSVTALQLMPLMFHDWKDVDQAREHLRPELERRLYDAGYVVLFWADAGWVRFFSRTPIEGAADLKSMRVLASDGDPDSIALMKAYYTPVVVEPDKVYLSLRNKMIDAAPIPPFLANAMQVATVAPYMVDLRWVPITGAMIVSRGAWEGLDPAARKWIHESSERAGTDLRRITRAEDEQAIKAMQDKQGLKVIRLSADAERVWREEVARMYPSIRGRLVPEEMFDEVVRILGQDTQLAP
jgi:TRAP-type C4-dicarboxylate transport system substrate-binding protein